MATSGSTFLLRQVQMLAEAGGGIVGIPLQKCLRYLRMTSLAVLVVALEIRRRYGSKKPPATTSAPPRRLAMAGSQPNPGSRQCGPQTGEQCSQFGAGGFEQTLDVICAPALTQGLLNVHHH